MFLLGKTAFVGPTFHSKQQQKSGIPAHQRNLGKLFYFFPVGEMSGNLRKMPKSGKSDWINWSKIKSTLSVFYTANISLQQHSRHVKLEMSWNSCHEILRFHQRILFSRNAGNRENSSTTNHASNSILTSFLFGCCTCMSKSHMWYSKSNIKK